MALKITNEHYELLKTEFNKIHNDTFYKEYQSKGLSDIRYCWDILWQSKAIRKLSLYDYLNDTNITSAVIKILKEANA